MTHPQILSRTQCPLSTKNYFLNIHITRTIIFSQNPRLASYNIHYSFILKIPRLFLHFPNPSLHIYTSSELTLRHISLRDPNDPLQFLRFARPRSRNRSVFSKSLSFSKYFLPILSPPRIPFAKIHHSTRKNVVFKAAAFSSQSRARETHLPRHVLPSSLPPSLQLVHPSTFQAKGWKAGCCTRWCNVPEARIDIQTRHSLDSQGPLASFRPFQPSSFPLRVCLFSPFRPHPPFSPRTRLTDPRRRRRRRTSFADFSLSSSGEIRRRSLRRPRRSKGEGGSSAENPRPVIMFKVGPRETNEFSLYLSRGTRSDCSKLSEEVVGVVK